jgi:hypothetical protein
MVGDERGLADELVARSSRVEPDVLPRWKAMA